MKYKFLLIFLTFFIDKFMIEIKKKKLNKYDNLYKNTILLIHLIFYISLFFENRRLLDFCHIIMALSVFLSIFLKNNKIIKLNCLFIILLNLMWNYFGLCILDEEQKDLLGSVFKVDYEMGSLIILIILISKFLI